MLETILNSYNKLNQAGYIADPYPAQDEELFQKILSGRADLKLLLWKKLKGDPQTDEERKQFTEMYSKFLE